MAIAANISVPDGAATPVVHVFQPQEVGLNTAVYHDRSVDQEIGRRSIEFSKVEPKSPGGVTKVSFRLSYPILEVSAPTSSSGYQPAPKVAYTITGIATFYVPKRALTQERKDLWAMFYNLAAAGTVQSAVQNSEMPW